MKNLYENQKVELMALLRREMNGAVVDGMKLYDNTSTLNSYGVSIPTIKSICKGFTPSHGFSQHLFKSKVRELKLCAIFLDCPSEVTIEQVEAWSDNMGSYEIMIHLSALFAKSGVIMDYIPQFLQSNNHLKVSLALLVISKIELDSANSAIFAKMVVMAISNFTKETSNGFIVASVALYNHYPTIKEQLSMASDKAKEQIVPFLA